MQNIENFLGFRKVAQKFLKFSDFFVQGVKILEFSKFFSKNR
jgi:hypothetical protein